MVVRGGVRATASVREELVHMLVHMAISRWEKFGVTQRKKCNVDDHIKTHGF